MRAAGGAPLKPACRRAAGSWKWGELEETPPLPPLLGGCEWSAGKVWSRAGRAGAGGDPRACVQAMPRRWSPSWLVLPASRWWSRLGECPWARGAASPARGGMASVPSPRCRSCVGGGAGPAPAGVAPAPGTAGLGQMEFWVDAGLPSRPGALRHGALPSIASPCARSGSIGTGRAPRCPRERTPGICVSLPATCEVSLGTLGGSAGWVTARMNPSRRTGHAVNQETFTLSSFSWFSVGFVGVFLEG